MLIHDEVHDLIKKKILRLNVIFSVLSSDLVLAVSSQLVQKYFSIFWKLWVWRISFHIFISAMQHDQQLHLVDTQVKNYCEIKEHLNLRMLTCAIAYILTFCKIVRFSFSLCESKRIYDSFVIYTARKRSLLRCASHIKTILAKIPIFMPVAIMSPFYSECFKFW